MRIFEVEAELAETRRKLAFAEMQLAGALKSEKALRQIIGAVLVVEKGTALYTSIQNYLPIPSVFSKEELSS